MPCPLPSGGRSPPPSGGGYAAWRCAAGPPRCFSRDGRAARAQDGGAMHEPLTPAADDLGDFTTTLRLLPISALAVCIGIVAAGVAAVLLKLIGLFTNLFFFQRIATTLVSPTDHHLGAFVIFVPV